MTYRTAVLAAWVTWACADAANIPQVERLTAVQLPGHVELSLVPVPGVRINALAPPALELVGGGAVRFTGPREATDSTYFRGSLSARIPGSARRVQGLLRISVCLPGESICRVLAQEVRLRVAS